MMITRQKNKMMQIVIQIHNMKKYITATKKQGAGENDIVINGNTQETD